jgi:putative glutamine amidotransferase
VIGVCASQGRIELRGQERQLALLPWSYVTAVQRAGGLTVMIPPDSALAEHPDEALDLIHGLILAGGADVDPGSYGHERHPMTIHVAPERDLTELALTKRAVERDIPLLGICRGMQLLNVAFGGTLCQHLPDDLPDERHRRLPDSTDDVDHEVSLAEGSLAAWATGERLHRGLSRHHQSVATIGEGLVVTGHSTFDQLPEAIEAPGRRFVLGVQWHPEADEHSRVIGALVAQARIYAGIRGSE